MSGLGNVGAQPALPPVTRADHLINDLLSLAAKSNSYEMRVIRSILLALLQDMNERDPIKQGENGGPMEGSKYGEPYSEKWQVDKTDYAEKLFKLEQLKHRRDIFMRNKPFWVGSKLAVWEGRLASIDYKISKLLED